MSSKMVCLYNKFGHCKFGSTCRNYHSKVICEKIQCESRNCQHRHPKKCRFYEEYGRCKYGEFCSFLHKESSSILVERKINDNTAKIDTLEARIVDFHVCMTLQKDLQTFKLLRFEKNSDFASFLLRVTFVVQCSVSTDRIHDFSQSKDIFTI